MNTSEPAKVDQALFGYSDGHRQIAASIRLPSKDLYHLSGASDLASGARLNPGESYLTGLPLNESRQYALIRTWPAPEMPRPGCVWSHVLLIDFKLLSAHGDLSDFLALFTPPENIDRGYYSKSLSMDLPIQPRPEPDHSSIAEMIGTYYSGSPVLLSAETAPGSLESSIMAVWSQQWPRLRMNFSFRTATSGERRKSELITYDVQVGSKPLSDFRRQSEEHSTNWVEVGAKDAATNRITPLRRFLWRYGRDLLAPRKHYRLLIELFVAAEKAGEYLLPEKAAEIFDAIPERGDGEILKHDILGVGSASSIALCHPVSSLGMLHLLATKRLGNSLSESDVKLRFGSIPPDQIGPVARYLNDHEVLLSGWVSIINAGIVASANSEAVLGNLPDRTRVLILLSRPDLIEKATTAILSNEAILELAYAYRTEDTLQKLASAIVRRDFASFNYQLLRSIPKAIFDAAIQATREQEIHAVWIQTIRNNVDHVIATNWLSGISKTSELAIGIYLLGFPRRNSKTTEDWASLLSSLEDDVSGEYRANLHSFLLRAAFQEMVPASWKLVASVLPDLRRLVLQNALPSAAAEMLGSDLPLSGAEYWDLNKRIAIALSRLRKHVPNDNGALHSIGLSEHEVMFVIEGAKEEPKRSKSLFWPWF